MLLDVCLLVFIKHWIFKESTEELDRIDASISEAASIDLKRWKMHDDRSADFCELEGKTKLD